MASEKRKLTLSKETLRTLSATALSQVAGGTAYSSQYCSPTVQGCCSQTQWTYEYPCAPTPCQTANAYTLCGPTATCGAYYGCGTSNCSMGCFSLGFCAPSMTCNGC